MLDIINTIFSTGGFEPHKVHFVPEYSRLMWLLVISNGAIAFLYFTMPFQLLYIYFKRPDFPFRWIFSAIPFFGFWCSASHVIMIISFWYPLYYIQAIVDTGTGIVSFITLLTFIPAAYKSLQLTGPDELVQENKKLEEVIHQYQKEKARLIMKTEELMKVTQMEKNKNIELSTLNKEMTDQELQMIELKREILRLRKL